MVDINWDDTYRGTPDQRPWDSGVVEQELVAGFQLIDSAPKTALEIGCGTGTNALWLAGRGLKVVGIDISPTAIEAAKTKAKNARANAEFKVHDILKESPAPPGAVDMVFDRGVFHVMSAEQRPLFVQRVADSLAHRGWWLCMAGSADETKPADQGPPRLTVIELLEHVEPKFEVHLVKHSSFAITMPGFSPYLAWLALFQKRD